VINSYGFFRNISILDRPKGDVLLNIIFVFLSARKVEVI